MSDELALGTGRTRIHAGRSPTHVGLMVPHVGRSLTHVGRSLTHVGRSLTHVELTTPHVGRAMPSALPHRLRPLISTARFSCFSELRGATCQGDDGRREADTPGRKHQSAVQPASDVPGSGAGKNSCRYSNLQRCGSLQGHPNPRRTKGDHLPLEDIGCQMDPERGFDSRHSDRLYRPICIGLANLLASGNTRWS